MEVYPVLFETIPFFIQKNWPVQDTVPSYIKNRQFLFFLSDLYYWWPEFLVLCLIYLFLMRPILFFFFFWNARMRSILHCTTAVSHVSKKISCQLFLKTICFWKISCQLLACQKTKTFKKKEMYGENLTADLEQLTRDVHLLAKVFWLCTYHAHILYHFQRICFLLASLRTSFYLNDVN